MEATRQAPFAEPTLADVLRDFWRAKAALAAGALAGLLCSLIFLSLAVPQYKAEMLVAPVIHAGSPDISSLFPESAGSAIDFMLQSFSPGDSSDFMRFEAILREPTVAARLLQIAEIRRGLDKAQRWSFLPAPQLDSAVLLAGWLKDNLDVEPVGATRLKRVIFRHPDPVFATLMLQTLYDTADNLIRDELQDRTARRIAYLGKAIGETANPDHKRTLTRLLMDQEQIAMILAVHEPFSASLAEPPATGAKPDWPRRSLVIPAFILLGFFLGYIVHGFRRK